MEVKEIKIKKKEEKKIDTYYIYVLRCIDNSLYTGIAKDYEDRYEKHLNGVGAKYTRVRKPIKIEKVWISPNRSEASKVEYLFKKKYNKKSKESFIVEEGKFEKEVYEKLELKIESIE